MPPQRRRPFRTYKPKKITSRKIDINVNNIQNTFITYNIVNTIHVSNVNTNDYRKLFDLYNSSSERKFDLLIGKKPTNVFSSSNSSISVSEQISKNDCFKNSQFGTISVDENISRNKYLEEIRGLSEDSSNACSFNMIKNTSLKVSKFSVVVPSKVRRSLTSRQIAARQIKEIIEKSTPIDKRIKEIDPSNDEEWGISPIIGVANESSPDFFNSDEDIEECPEGPKKVVPYTRPIRTKRRGIKRLSLLRRNRRSSIFLNKDVEEEENYEIKLGGVDCSRPIRTKRRGIKRLSLLRRNRRSSIFLNKDVEEEENYEIKLGGGDCSIDNIKAPSTCTETSFSFSEEEKSIFHSPLEKDTDSSQCNEDIVSVSKRLSNLKLENENVDNSDCKKQVMHSNDETSPENDAHRVSITESKLDISVSESGNRNRTSAIEDENEDDQYLNSSIISRKSFDNHLCAEKDGPDKGKEEGEENSNGDEDSDDEECRRFENGNDHHDIESSEDDDNDDYEEEDYDEEDYDEEEGEELGRNVEGSSALTNRSKVIDAKVKNVSNNVLNNDSSFFLSGFDIDRKSTFDFIPGKKYRRSITAFRHRQSMGKISSDSTRRNSIVIRPSGKVKASSRMTLITTINECLDQSVSIIKVDEDKNAAKQQVLQLCNQTDILDFSMVLNLRSNIDMKKIGEGVYGEVFMVSNTMKDESLVVKIIPVEGSIKYNGEIQKKFHEIISELHISLALSNLKKEAFDRAQFWTDNYCHVVAANCFRGKYPSFLLKLWHIFDMEKGSDNDSPIIFSEDQLYVSLKMSHGGEDLQRHQFASARQAYSIVVQVILALAVAEESLQFEHRDLHIGNILVSKTKEKALYYKINGEEYKVASFWKRATIIDYTLSRIHSEDLLFYNDLEKDEELFLGQGDIQFQIYRDMREDVKNEWHLFKPRTNVRWINYLAVKCFTDMKYTNTTSSTHKSHINKLKVLADEILLYDSCWDYVHENL